MCQKCIDAKATIEKLKANIEAWKAVNPEHCPTCLGWGSNGKPSDPSVGMFAPEPCDDCIGKGKCPLCAHQHDEDWTGEQCAACGWLLDDSLGAPDSDWLPEECDDLVGQTERYMMEYFGNFDTSVEMDDDFFRRSDEAYDERRERGYRNLGGY